MKQVWKADDGTVFDTKIDCETYEEAVRRKRDYQLTKFMGEHFTHITLPFSDEEYDIYLVRLNNEQDVKDMFEIFEEIWETPRGAIYGCLKDFESFPAKAILYHRDNYDVYVHPASSATITCALAQLSKALKEVEEFAK